MTIHWVKSHGDVLPGCCLYSTCEEPTACYIIVKSEYFFHMHSRCAQHIEEKKGVFGPAWNHKTIGLQTYATFKALSAVAQEIVLSAWFPSWQSAQLGSEEDPEVGF